MPEGGVKEASEGFLYPFGGSYILGGDLTSAEHFKPELPAVMSGHVEDYSCLMREDEEETAMKKDRKSILKGVICISAVILLLTSSLSFAEALSIGKTSWRNFFEHAVNVKGPKGILSHRGKVERSLDNFLKSPTPIAEGDIRFSSKGRLVMAHDLENANDADRPTFKEWFSAILTCETKISPKHYSGFKRKGVKLDIKEDNELNRRLGLTQGAASRQVIQEIKELIEEKNNGISEDTIKKRFVMANGDIVQGPGGAEPALTVVDLLHWRREFPHIRISIGYTQDEGRSGYTRYMAHTQFANAVTLGGRIDFNLRAPRVLNSLAVVKEKIAFTLDHPEVTFLSLTVWNWPDKGDGLVTQVQLDTYLKKLLPDKLPAGKKAIVLLDLRLPR